MAKCKRRRVRRKKVYVDKKIDGIVEDKAKKKREEQRLELEEKMKGKKKRGGLEEEKKSDCANNLLSHAGHVVSRYRYTGAHHFGLITLHR